MVRRDEILRAAAENFAEAGYAATTFATIGARVGVHRNALQHYIASKPELAAEVAWKPFREGVFPTPQTVNGSGLTAIRHFSDALAESYVNDVFARASMRLIEDRRIIPAELPRAYPEWGATCAAFLLQAVEDGEISCDADPDDLAWRLIATVAGTRVVSTEADELPLLPARARRTVDDLLKAHAPA